MRASRQFAEMREHLWSLLSQGDRVHDGRNDGRRKTLLSRCATHASVLIAWELLSRFVIPPQFLPPPSAVVRAFVTTTASASCRVSSWQTVSVLAVGLRPRHRDRHRRRHCHGDVSDLRRILDPYVNAFYAMPTVALVPLVIIWLGLGFEAKVFLTWLVSIFPVIINAQIGVFNVPPVFMKRHARSVATRWQVFRRVVLQPLSRSLLRGSASASAVR